MLAFSETERYNDASTRRRRTPFSVLIDFSFSRVFVYMATATVRVVDVNVFLCSCESIQCVTTTAAAIIICFVDFSSLIAAMLFAGIETQKPSN